MDSVLVEVGACIIFLSSTSSHSCRSTSSSSNDLVAVVVRSCTCLRLHQVGIKKSDKMKYKSADVRVGADKPHETFRVECAAPSPAYKRDTACPKSNNIHDDDIGIVFMANRGCLFVVDFVKL